MEFSQLIIGGGNRRWVLKRALLLFLPPALLLCTVAYHLYTTERDANLNTLTLSEQASVDASNSVITAELTSAKTNLRFIRALTERLLYPPEHNGAAHLMDRPFATLTSHFMDMVTIERKYDQARLLDNAGREVIRINLQDDHGVLVPEDRLQDKSGRYYVNSTMALESGETYVSPFDLNVEYGEIEMPLKPMLRLGTKVEDATGRTRGMVLLNFLGETLLDSIHTLTRAGPGSLMVVNTDGFWIHNHDAGREWGFMLGREKDRFQVDFPDAWSQISTNDNGQLRTPAGLFTFASVYPNLDYGNVMEGAGTPNGVKRMPPFDEFWKIISLIPQVHLDKINQEPKQRWSLVAGSALFLIAFIAFFIAQAQSARQEIATRMRRLETQESLGQLANGMAHEFNNLLLPIHALSEMVMNNQPKDSPSHRRLEKVVEASSRAKTLVEGILVFSKESQEEGASCDAKACISDAMTVIRNTLPSTAKLTEKYADAIPPIALNSRQLRVILVNLLSNARDALEGHVGTVTVTLDTTQPSAADSMSLGLPNDVTYARLTINDSGQGMNVRTLQQALDPFFTTKSVGEGHGLGLYQVNTLVNTAGGALSINSTPNLGTTVTVWLPLSADHMD